MAHSATVSVQDGSLSVMCDQCLTELNSPPNVAIGSAWLAQILVEHFGECSTSKSECCELPEWCSKDSCKRNSG